MKQADIRRLVSTAAVTAAIVAAQGPPAQAQTLVSEFDIGNGGQEIFIEAGNESNKVTVERRSDGGRWFYITDSRAGVHKSGDRCQIYLSAVRCEAAGVIQINANLRAGSDDFYDNTHNRLPRQQVARNTVPESVSGGQGVDHLQAGIRADVISGGSEFDLLTGGPPDPEFADEGDMIVGGPGPDTINGRAGDDAVLTIGDGAVDTAACGPHLNGDYFLSDPFDNISGCERVFSF